MAEVWRIAAKELGVNSLAYVVVGLNKSGISIPGLSKIADKWGKKKPPRV